MKIVNVTRGTEVCSAGRIAGNPARRLIGLMFRAGLPPGSALILEPCDGIHTCFMRFRLDVMFISPEWRVIRVERAVPPWRFIPRVRGAKRVVELPAGVIEASATTVGDVLLPDVLLPMDTHTSAHPPSARALKENSRIRRTLMVILAWPG